MPAPLPLVSPYTFVQLFIALLYGAVGYLSFRWLLPRLSWPGRALALSMLAAQLLALFVATVIRPESTYQSWLWGVNQEWNITASLASTQLALVGALAFIGALQARDHTPTLRGYLLLVSGLFFFLALDEFLQLHEHDRRIEQIYSALYLTLLAMTAIVFARADRTWRVWLLCLVMGLGMAGVGGILFEQLRYLKICGELAILQLSECWEPYYYEEALEFCGIWLALIAVLGVHAQLVPRPRPGIAALLAALPALWIAVLLIIYPSRDVPTPRGFDAASVAFESGAHIYGSKLTVAEAAVDMQLAMHLPEALPLAQLGHSLHLVDQQSGASVAAHNTYVALESWRKVSRRIHDYKPLLRQSAKIAVPASAPRNRALWVVLSLWREDGSAYVQQKILSSSHPLLSDTQVILGEIALQAPASSGDLPPALARFDNGFALQPVTLPASASAGTSLPITFRWRADSASREDYGQFLHMQHIESGEWVVYNQPPLGARLPTRLWYSGLDDSETWQLPLPAELAPGGYALSTGLYRVSDKERLPARDAQGAPFTDARIPLGIVHVQ